jgi:TonB family protein
VFPVCPNYRTLPAVRAEVNCIASIVLRSDSRSPEQPGSRAAPSATPWRKWLVLGSLPSRCGWPHRAAQLTASTGFERLDSAYLDAVVNGQMIPATIDGQPVFYWPEMPIAWFQANPPARPNFNPFLLPKVREDYQLKIGADYYPPESRERHQEGDCTIHGFVKEDGTVINIAVSKSTGFAALDQACIVAIQQAAFMPANEWSRGRRILRHRHQFGDCLRNRSPAGSGRSRQAAWGRDTSMASGTIRIQGSRPTRVIGPA